MPPRSGATSPTWDIRECGAWATTPTTSAGRSCANSGSWKRSEWPSSGRATWARPWPATGASSTGAFRSRVSTTSIRTRSGRSVHGFPIKHIDHMDEDARNGIFAIAIIATPAEHAPEVLERLGVAGVRSILNFAPAVLRPPSAVEVRNVDLSTELQILSFYRTHRS